MTRGDFSKGTTGEGETNLEELTPSAQKSMGAIQKELEYTVDPLEIHILAPEVPIKWPVNRGRFGDSSWAA